MAGTLLGNWWVLPVIDPFPVDGVKVFIPLWINVTAPLGMLALAALAAAVPAVRAGRLPVVEAIAAGQAPRAGRGAVAYRLAGRLGLPAPVTVGLASAFSRPALQRQRDQVPEAAPQPGRCNPVGSSLRRDATRG